MAYFDRFDICQAHYAMEIDYHRSGILQERPSNVRRCMSTDYQLRRMGFKAGHSFNGFDSLSDNGKEIYLELVERYGLSHSDDVLAWIDETQFTEFDGKQVPARLF